MPRIYVIHENDAWVEPLRTAFDELDLPYAEWFVAEGTLDLASVPPEGVFYNRMSASSHTRGHRYAAELTGGILAWLEAHGRRIVQRSPHEANATGLERRCGRASEDDHAPAFTQQALDDPTAEKSCSARDQRGRRARAHASESDRNGRAVAAHFASVRR